MRSRVQMFVAWSVLMFLGCVWSGAAFARDGEGAKPNPLASPTSEKRPVEVGDPDAADDPPGLIANDRVEGVSRLAAWLSREDRWLTHEVIDTLDQLSLRLDEVFETAPRYFSLNGLLYEIKIDSVGDAWAGFDPEEDAYVVFITQELYSGLGTDHVLAYVGGKEEILTVEKLGRVPALGLAVSKVSSRAAIEKNLLTATELGEPVALGRPRLAIDRAAPDPGHDVPSKCFLTQTPDLCLASLAFCPAGTEPFFILTGVQIFDDHESSARGKPEIEIFPFSRDTVPGDPFDDPPRTHLIFDGRYVTDKFGRSVYLPDVNKKDRWYDVSNFAMLPLMFDPLNPAQVAEGAGTWVASMVEDDDRRGILETDFAGSVTARIFRDVGANQSFVERIPFLNLRILRPGIIRGLFRSFIFDRGDDFFEPIGFTPEVMCRDGLLGDPVIIPGDDWELRGTFRCARSCGGPPPPSCNSTQCANSCGGPGQGFCTAGGQCVCA